MKIVSDRQVKSLFCKGFYSYLAFVFFMVNTGVLFAQSVTIDDIQFSNESGQRREVFLPGESGKVRVDYTLVSDEDKNVSIKGKVSGTKIGRNDKEKKWNERLISQKGEVSPGSNSESFDFVVDPAAIVGSEANANINIKIKGRDGEKVAGTETFEIVDTVPTPFPDETSFPTSTPDVTATSSPVATSTPVGEPSAPVLGSIGDQTVTVGDTLTINITATDLNKDDLLFTVTPLPLIDNASFNASSGVFTFSPAVDQAGNFQLTFSVSDGALTDSETITITVEAPSAEGDTALKGQMLDANDADIGITTPIVGATITNEETDLSTTTDNNGNFLLGGLTSGENHFDFDGTTATNLTGSTYGMFRGMQEIIANATNVIPRPVYLMRLETEGEVQVDPNSETVVENERLDVKLEIPAQTVMNEDGSFYTGMLSISEVPTEFTPASLPDTLEPAMVLTIQPAGLSFDQPAPITLPNPDNLVPGTQVDIWSLDHTSGQFFIAGTGEVSADGSEITTVEGGITASSWHFSLSTLARLGDPTNPDCQCKKKDCKKKTGSETSVASGDLTISHSLVSYRSLGKTRSLEFVYNSDRANPQPIISSTLTNQKEADVPNSISSKLTFAGVVQGTEVFTDTSGLDQDADDTIIKSLQFDASDLETGRYSYRIAHTSHFDRSAVSSTTGGFVLVNNQINSPCGAGWTIDGLQNILTDDDGNVLLTEGDGSALVFKPAAVGSGDFAASTSFFVNEGRIDGVAAGDFNNDSKLDLVVLDDLFGAGVSIMLNDGKGAFEKKVTFELASSSQQVTVDDFNKDNNLDIAVTTRANISVLLGDGTGNFAEPVLFTGGNEPEAVTTGDFNKDGNVDMAVTNDSDGTVSIFIGDGAGAFSDPTNFTAGNLPQAITSSDFNSDGSLDLAVVNRNGNNVTILLGNGNGGFTTSGAEEVTVGDSPVAVKAADFNNDGIIDLAVTNDFSNHVSLLIGDGTGLFTVQDIQAGGAQGAIAADDFNGDNNLDMAMPIGSNINVIGVLLGDGKGQFSDPVNYRAGAAPDKIAAGDFDGDKIIDLAMTDFNSETVVILRGDGEGGFTDTPKFFGTGQNGFTVSGEDLNNDGINDFTVLTRNGVNVIMGVGDFTYASSNSFSSGGADPRSFTVNDFNNDGISDLAVASFSSDIVGILIGDGTGSFAEAVKVATGNGPTPIVSSDFNNDGNVDLAVVNTIDSNADDPTVSLLMGDGNVGFSESKFDVGERPTSISLVDFNNDGIDDLAITDDKADIVSIYFGDGAGKFGDSVDFALGENANPQFLKAGDLDKDSSIDLVVLNSHSGSSSLLNTIEVLFGDGTNGIISSINFNNGKGPISLALDDLDGDGILDIAVGNQDSDDVTIYLGDGSGTFVKKNTYGIGGQLSLGTSSIEMITGDFNEDGILDVATTDEGAPVGVNVLLGLPSNETGFQSPPGEFSTLVQNADASFTRIMTNGFKFNFNSNGLQTSSEDRNGNKTVFAYNNDNNLISVTDPVGLLTSLTYSGNRISKITDPAGRSTTFEHDNNGNLVSISDPDGSSRKFEYDDSHRIISQTAKLGFVTLYTFDSFGKIAMTTLPDGSTNQMTPGNTIGLIDVSGGKGTEDNPAAVVRPDDVASVFVDSNGNQTTFETNRFGANDMIKDPLGNTTLVTRDDDSNPVTIEEPNGSLTRMEYDELGNLLLIEEAANSDIKRRTSFDYDPLFNLITRETEPNGNVTNFEYDENGNLLKKIDSLNGEQEFTYDVKGQLLTVTDQNGSNTTSLSYDANGNLETMTLPAGNVVRLQWDNAGNNSSTTEEDADGTVTRRSTNTYDSHNRLLTSTKGSQGTTKLSYDKAGNVSTIENATGEVTTFEYDELGRATSINDPVRGESKFTYDINGNVVKSEDASGNSKTYQYDEVNQLIKTTDALSGEESLGYDGQGNLVSFTDALDQNTKFEYDELNRLVKKTDPLGFTTQFSYDLNSNLTAKTDAKGQVINYSYDGLSRLNSIATPDGNTIAFSYSANGNLVALSDNDSSLTFSYDQNDRIINTATIDVGFQPAVALTSSYNSAGKRIQLDDSAGGSSGFIYNDAGRMTQMTTSAGGNIGFSYDSVGGLIQISYPNGASSNISYDLSGRLDNVSHSAGGGSIASFAYERNGLGEIITVTELNKTREFTYDALRRLTSAGSSSSPESYTYDLLGNRVTSALSGSHKHDAGNSLKEDDNFTYAYDNNGNLLTKTARNGGDVTTYTWNSQDQLTKIDFSDGTTAQYCYDGLGRRFEKNVNGTITRYIYDGFNILLEYDGSNALVARYSYGENIDQVLSMERDGQSCFYHTDNIDSIRKVTDSAGAVVNTYDYDSFGRFETRDESVTNLFTYTGREFDSESGLYYYRARYYDPETGRFINKDPLGFFGGNSNLYAYVRNSPVNINDPTGLNFVVTLPPSAAELALRMIQLGVRPELVSGGLEATMSIAQVNAYEFTAAEIAAAGGGSSAGGFLSVPTAAAAGTAAGIGLVGAAVVVAPFAYAAYQAHEGAALSEQQATLSLRRLLLDRILRNNKCLTKSDKAKLEKAIDILNDSIANGGGEISDDRSKEVDELVGEALSGILDQ